MSAVTYGGEDGHQVPLRPLVIQRPIDRHLALMRQVDAKVAVAIGGGDAVASDAVAVAEASAIAGRD